MKFSSLSLAVLAGTASSAVMAQNYTIKVGGAYIRPNATSSEFSGDLPVGGAARQGVTLEVQPKSTLIVSIERRLNDNMSVELVLGAPPKHDVKLKVSEATRSSNNIVDHHFAEYHDQRVATVTQSAPTFFFNYKFGASSDLLRPFVGVGINHTRMKASLTSEGESLYLGVPMKQVLTSSTALAVQAGATYRVDERWSMSAGIASTRVKSTLTVSGNGKAHTAEFDFKPVALSVNAGYAF